MTSRRGFLRYSGYSALAGTALASTGLSQSAASNATPPNRKPIKASADKNQQEFLKRRVQYLKTTDAKQFLGYPINLNLPSQGFLDWQQSLETLEYGSRSMNNVGDPFYQRGVTDSHYLEADLIERFAQRYGYRQDNIWGFVSHSGTDSNMHGLYMGKTLLEKRSGQRPKIYYTSEAHYSVQIIRDLLHLEEVVVDSNQDGSINAKDLAKKIQQNSDSPVLLLATIGTTFAGAIDDLDSINQAIGSHQSYIHLDAALFGGFLHVSPYAEEFAVYKNGKKRYDSMSISCHKFFGFQSVAGLYFMHKNVFEEFKGYFADAHDPAYITHVPGTITCSRDARSPALFHYYCTEEAIAQQRTDYKNILQLTQYLHQQLRQRFPELNAKRSNKHSNILYFYRVHQDIVDRWTLAVVDNKGNNKSSYAHLVLMPHIDRTMIDRFLQDLESHRKTLLNV